MKREKTVGNYLKYVLIYFAYFMAMGMFGSMLSVYLGGLGKNAKEISLIVSASGIFTVIAQPFIGILYDKWNKDRLISMVLLGLSAVSGVLFAMTRMTAALFLLNGFTMAFLNSVNPVIERIAAESPFRYGVTRLWGAVGYAVACQISGVFLEKTTPILIFAVFAAAAVLTGIGFLLVRDLPVKKTEERETASLKDLFQNGSYLCFLLICFLFSGVTGAGATYIPVLMNGIMGNATLVGTVLFLGTLMEIPIIFLSNRFMDRLYGKQLLLINSALVVIQFLLYSFLKNAVLLSAVIFLTKSVSTMLFIMVTLKVVMDLTHGKYATTALAVAGTAKVVGSVVFTWIAGLIIDYSGIQAAFLMMSCVALANLLCAVLIWLPEDEESYFSGNKGTK